MCAHRWFATLGIVFVLTFGWVLNQAAIHQPKEVIKTVTKCDAPKADWEIKQDMMNDINTACTNSANRGIETFKVVKDANGEWMPEFKCRD